MSNLEPKESAYLCWRCKRQFTFQQPDSSYSCPTCGTLLAPAPKSLCWIFQNNPKMYQWKDRLKDTWSTNKPEQWLASQNSEYMKKDDLVAIWQTGKTAGIYALAQIKVAPTDLALPVEDQKYWRSDKAINKFLYHKSVLIAYFQDLTANLIVHPILRQECEADQMLSSISALSPQQATNLKLEPNEWKRIVELATKR